MHRWVSLLGAAMSAMYSTIAFGTSVAVAAGNAPGGVSYAPREEGRAALVFGVFNALGAIMFAFGGHAILLEVQVRPCALIRTSTAWHASGLPSLKA